MKLATHASHRCISLTLQSNNVILHTSVTVAVFMQNYYFKYFLLIILVWILLKWRRRRRRFTCNGELSHFGSFRSVSIDCFWF